MEKVYTVKEITEYLKLHKTTVFRMIKDGRLKAIKIGKEYRFKETDIQEFLQRKEN